MKRMFGKQLQVALFAVIAVLLCSSVGYGQAKINMPEGRWVSVGGGMRQSFTSNETGSGTGSYDRSFSTDSLRLYINSEFHKDFAIEVNTEFAGLTSSSNGDIKLLDAVVKYQPNEMFNIWMGRHLTPSDRANLDGPYFQVNYSFPDLVSRYPALFAGRDNGVSVSGKLAMGKAKYAVGVYEGQQTVLGASDSNLYAARVTYNVFDSEPDAGGKSGYYTGSTYYGEKDQILTIGAVAQYQDSIVAESGVAKSFFGYNADLLYEKKMTDKSVVTVEGAYYKYNVGRNGVAVASSLQHGSAFMFQAAYLFPEEIGVGKFQPIARYQDFREASRMDLGSNYIIRGHSARLTFMYSPTYNGGAWNNRVNNYIGGAQFQF
jgi:hypothetical protein